MTVFSASVVFRDTMKTMVFCTLTMVFPLLIHLAGIEKIDLLFFNIFLSGNMFLDYAAAGHAALILIPVILGVASYQVLRTYTYRKI